jgi:hypothetical protein
MPNFHFDLSVQDRQGAAMPDLAAARSHAAMLARKVVSQINDCDRDLSAATIRITDERGREVLRLGVLEAACPEAPVRNGRHPRTQGRGRLRARTA